MTELTDEQLTAIEATAHTVIPSAAVGQLMSALRPKPKFADDQVVFRSRFNTYDTYRFSRSAQCRALTPTEMGPLVQELFKYAEHSASRAGNTSAQDLIKRFKEVHGDA